MSLCYHCHKQLKGKESHVTLMGTIYDENGIGESYTITNHLDFHAECFETIAGKEYADAALKDPKPKKKPGIIDVDKAYKKMGVRSSLPNPFPYEVGDGHTHWFIGWGDFSDICERCGLIRGTSVKPSGETHYPPHRE